jgi:NAD+ kinase
MLKRVAIFSKDNNSKTDEAVTKLIEEFNRKEIRVLIHKRNGSSIPKKGAEYFDSLSDLNALPDLVLSIGGDGTFLETIIQVQAFGIPIAGVNTGRMGFLANISPNDIPLSVRMLCDGEYDVVDRSLLKLLQPDGLFEGNASSALNEITIQKSDLSMITINVYVNDVHLNTYWSDGLIISTATGSTAYNLSVGGPILSPEDKSIIIVPIAPHNLTVRPIIVSGDSRLRMVVEGRSHQFMTTVDFRSKKLSFGQDVHIARAPVIIRTIMLKGTDFFSTLRNKLMWGADRRN